MTTTGGVVVKANHGWPVDVSAMKPGAPEHLGEPQRVEAGETREFYVHSDQDLRIHEVQPEEAVATP